MTGMRRVRETLKVLRGEMADIQQCIVWVSHEAGESHAEAVERTVAQHGLTRGQPGMILISWLPPGQGTAAERGVIR